MGRARRNRQKSRIPKPKTIHFVTTTTHSNGHETVVHVVRYTSSKVMATHPIIIGSDGTEALAPSAAQPRKYPRNAASAREIPVHPPEATEGYNSSTVETKSVKPAEAGEQTKGAQCKGWHPPFQESGQENRGVDQKIQAKPMDGEGHDKTRHEYEEQLPMKRVVSLSFDPTHDIFGEGGAQVIDDSSWEVIDYPGPA
jgi:hypothetical protein